MKWTVKNMLFLFLFVIAAILVAKWLGNRVPAIGKITNQIQEGNHGKVYKETACGIGERAG